MMTDISKATAALKAWKCRMEQPIGDVLIGVEDIEHAFVAGYNSRDDAFDAMKEALVDARGALIYGLDHLAAIRKIDAALRLASGEEQ